MTLESINPLTEHLQREKDIEEAVRKNEKKLRNQIVLLDMEKSNITMLMERKENKLYFYEAYLTRDPNKGPVLNTGCIRGKLIDKGNILATSVSLIDTGKFPKEKSEEEPGPDEPEQEKDSDDGLRNLSAHEYWSPEDLKKLVELYNNNVKFKEIAKKLNRTTNAIKSRLTSIRAGKNKFINSNALKNRQFKWDPEEIRKVVILYNKSYSIKRIALLYETTESTINALLSRIKEGYYEGFSQKSLKEKLKRTRFSEEEVKDILFKFNSGIPVKIIAGQLGSSGSTIYALLDKIRKNIIPGFSADDILIKED